MHKLGVITRWLFRLNYSMCVPNIYVVGFKTITQIMLTVAYSTLMEAIIRIKQLKKVWFTHNVIYFSHRVKIYVLDTNTEIVYIFFIIKPNYLLILLLVTKQLLRAPHVLVCVTTVVALERHTHHRRFLDTYGATKQLTFWAFSQF
jgi:hypothetical protein